MRRRVGKFMFFRVEEMIIEAVLAALLLSLLPLAGTPFLWAAAAETSPETSPGAAAPPVTALRAAPAAESQAAQSFSQSKIAGISFTNWVPGARATPRSDTSMTNLRATGANWIAFPFLGYQQTLTSTTIFKGELTPTDVQLIHDIEKAHSLGLKVMLKPQMRVVDSDPTDVNNPIGKAFTSSQEWDAWFLSYQTFIDHYADIAQAEGVELFCVGTELWGTAYQSSRWRDVIASVRIHYHGPLTYSALHSGTTPGEEVSISWWDALDYLGVSAYYHLTEQESPTLNELNTAWTPYVDMLSSWASKWEKPVLFTEVGYRDIDRSAWMPGDYWTQRLASPEQQAQAYQAVFDNFWNQPWFAGMFWWEWLTDPDQGLPPNIDYTPHNRPAEQVLRSWYATSSSRFAAVSGPRATLK